MEVAELNSLAVVSESLGETLRFLFLHCVGQFDVWLFLVGNLLSEIQIEQLLLDPVILSLLLQFIAFSFVKLRFVLLLIQRVDVPVHLPNLLLELLLQLNWVDTHQILLLDVVPLQLAHLKFLL